MAFTFGFYNALNHDRLYDAKTISRIFDGLITDGVYSEVGDRFIVKAASTNNAVIISSGRAWFDHTWNYNDADLQITGDSSDLLLNRWDAVVIDIDLSISNRSNQLLWVTGKAATNPVKPTMINTDDHKQHPLAYIYRKINNDEISASDIYNTVGSDECPYVESILTDTKNIASSEINDTASKSYSIGEYVLWQNLLYKVTSPISVSVPFVPYPNSGYNITRVTIGEELYKSLTVDTTITAGSQHPVTSQAIYNALKDKFDVSGGTLTGPLNVTGPISASSNLIVQGQLVAYNSATINSNVLIAGKSSASEATLTIGSYTDKRKGLLELRSGENSTHRFLFSPVGGISVDRTITIPDISGTMGIVGENVLAKAAITYGTAGKTAGTSALTTGYVYLQYE